MALISVNIETVAEEISLNLAESGLTQSQAKLYSQYTRLRTGQPSLVSWSQEEFLERLNDAVRLIEVAFIQKESGGEYWRNTLRRAAELLEWLSPPDINPDQLPLRLLSAAAYQLAGYPARATGLLMNWNSTNNESDVLFALLQADFPFLLRALADYWNDYDQSLGEQELDVERLIIDETASSLGVLASYFRWGEEPRIEKAISKMEDIGKVLLSSGDSYSWLLAKLCAAVSREYVDSSLRSHVAPISNTVTASGKKAIERYLRHSYQTCRALAWPSQIEGIQQLSNNQSFALCTPTGSGKTTIAEIAILQGLFSGNTDISEMEDTPFEFAPLAIYLVPSRALATEVEWKLSRVLRELDSEPTMHITGLYGGTDWGPTDAWLTSQQRTVLICTYEKGEALVRFLGPLFLRRVKLVVIDEAHKVQFDRNEESLRESTNRSLRLESLGTRLLSYLEGNTRIVALSAVASGMQAALAGWVSGQDGATAVEVDYQSTRRLIGRLECLPGRGFEIRYDLLDGADLTFSDSGVQDSPYIPHPFPTHPPAPTWESQGPQKRLRPSLFWAALNLATGTESTPTHTVLISISQHIDGYAKDFLALLEKHWVNQTPEFFQVPTEPFKLSLWEKCLRSCEDYFTRDSTEYKLLLHGIVVHHGKMPSLLSRLLVEVLRERIAHIVLATSTLSEGINLPFETVLIPSLTRGTTPLSPQEFKNLTGRAGRPGHTTEGRSLVLMQAEPSSSQPAAGDWQIRRQRRLYFSMIDALKSHAADEDVSTTAVSPLAVLMTSIFRQWQIISSSSTFDEFIAWLETVKPATSQSDSEDDAVDSFALISLDSLDAFLLSAIVEIEEIANRELDVTSLEDELVRVWQHTYAHYASQTSLSLERIFITRGIALRETIYPDIQERKRYYRTSLPPRSANLLLQSYASIKEQLSTGGDYALWTIDEKLAYIGDTAELLARVPAYASITATRIRQPMEWRPLLHWWLAPRATETPPMNKIPACYEHISTRFTYQFCWGLGSLIAIAINEVHNGELREPSLEEWDQTGLPWIVFWLKELLTWGTLDPVAAYLLAKGIFTTRPEAEAASLEYYHVMVPQNSNQALNAITIKNWVDGRFPDEARGIEAVPLMKIDVSLRRDFSNAARRLWRVLPVERHEFIHWFDPAGYLLAECAKPNSWQPSFFDDYDFMLDSAERVVSSGIQSYLYA